MPDILTIAVHGVDYYQSDGRTFPGSLTIRWAMAGHPCDGAPYLLGIDFPEGDA